MSMEDLAPQAPAADPFAGAQEKLEFKSVLDRVRRHAVSEPGKERTSRITPSVSCIAIQTMLSEVSEAKELVIAEGNIPLDGIKPIAAALKKSAVENHVLTTRELLDVASTLGSARILHAFLVRRRPQMPLLAGYADRLFYDKIVEFNILQALEEDGRVKDSASRELRRIRGELISVGEALRKRLAAILKSVSEQDFLQEEVMTTRDGRLVVPVKTEYKKRVPGFIHSTSASGATVFIEPAETLELNNTLTELHLQEQREIERILRELTVQVREICKPMELSLDVLTELDVIFAKAKYSIECIAEPPHVVETGILSIVQGRHPVLLQRHPRESIVPLDCALGGENRTLVITGPNAGGKSVAMKTAGIFALMAQSGMHLPASIETVLPIFHAVYVDIGDDQSIENDLSTFSSHLMNLRQIVESADERSLVLIDEIGAGTDPAEGSALAAAVLSHLTVRGALTITTTHHGTLKVFAHDTPGVMNGSMEFDQEHIAPTYRFRPGTPGSSFALELASRLGMPAQILGNARGRLGEQESRLERLLMELERQSQELRSQNSAVREERTRVDAIRTEYDQKMREAKREAASIKKQAQADAADVVRKAKGLIEQSVREIRERQADKTSIKAAQERVRTLEEEHKRETKQKDGVPLPVEKPFAVGDKVKVAGGNSMGEIVELRGSAAIVLTGHSRMTIRLDALVHIEGKDKTERPYLGHVEMPDAAMEVDVRGLLGDEAIARVERFLDDAYVTGLHRVSIIHGKGTGALRKRITDFLKTYPRIKKYQLGEWNEGGDGVTVVELADA